jgi:hypothetical protein
MEEQGLGKESCLYYNGKRRWCLRGWGYEDSWYMEYEGRDLDHVQRYWVYDHKDQVLGYLRRIVRGQWRAMVLTCFSGPKPCQYVRDGRAVRISRTVFYVYTHGGRRREIARGPDADAVAAHKLVLGDCTGGFCG